LTYFLLACEGASEHQISLDAGKHGLAASELSGAGSCEIACWTGASGTR
jgi:hypothetical protein